MSVDPAAGWSPLCPVGEQWRNRRSRRGISCRLYGERSCPSHPASKAHRVLRTLTQRPEGGSADCRWTTADHRGWSEGVSSEPRTSPDELGCAMDVPCRAGCRREQRGARCSPATSPSVLIFRRLPHPGLASGLRRRRGSGPTGEHWTWTPSASPSLEDAPATFGMPMTLTPWCGPRSRRPDQKRSRRSKSRTVLSRPLPEPVSTRSLATTT